ncbi:hypothetical protein FO440_11835 [Mucilaginibacter corticis]|uniref:Translation elongation factor EFTu/EF1A C-terminal domain-containing protein n=1 Tax=Mucilaginibacter corticis TaxID=2597670 RepID=A0A556MKJ7_9SPHI|nr:hypothetical protein [Mucilaginibacter corticis]TSJ40441.1 hypothetical protein FO440_11835 [Mucilaginibacter corticis]
MNKQPDFIAELTYRTNEQGGRSTSALSGYRPHIKFAFSEYQTTGQQKFLNKEIVYPGESVSAEISILSVDFFKHKLKKYLEFEFREGSRVIGTGRIIDILNPDLLVL